MCGIAGIIGKKGAKPALSAIRRMTDLVAHRGPDGQGQYIWNNVALGHRRLSIVDLSEAGHQPFEYGDYVITYNGEVYNYLELRQELEGCGYQFRSRTDTEVILAAYHKWGADCLSRFNGMWAFAILDRAKGTLFCARDRFGVKPFYFAESATEFVFGSEIKQVLPALGRVSANRDGLMRFLVTGLRAEDGTTLFAGVRSLPAGHTLVLDARTCEYTISPYYALRAAEMDCASEAQVAEKFLELFESAVRLRLRSDVRVGTCLSGGLDSSAIAIIASRFAKVEADTPFCAVTGCSTDPQYDESAFAQTVVQTGGLEWKTVTPSGQDVADAVEDFLYHQEEPVPGGSQIMQYMVMRLARQSGIPVLLDGQGADETLLGYGSYNAMLAAHHLRSLRFVKASTVLLDSRRQESAAGIGRCFAEACEQMVPRLRIARYKRRAAYSSSAPEMLSLFANWRDALHDVAEYQKAEIATMTLPNLLRYEDRNSMAFAVEARLPFLDYRLVEFCLALPVQMKINRGWRKWILRRSMENSLPRNIVWRKGKMGFAAPDRQWQTKMLDRMRAEVLGCEVTRGLLVENRLAAMWSSLDCASRWRLYSVALWARLFGVEARALAA